MNVWRDTDLLYDDAVVRGDDVDLRAVAEECCRGRMVLVVEGGYDLQALAGSLDAVIETLSAPASAQPAQWPTSGVASTRGEASVDAVRSTLTPFWTL